MVTSPLCPVHLQGEFVWVLDQAQQERVVIMACSSPKSFLSVSARGEPYTPSLEDCVTDAINHTAQVGKCQAEVGHQICAINALLSGLYGVNHIA